MSFEYRSIDATWEDDDIIYIGERDSYSEVITYLLRINNQTKKIISYIPKFSKNLLFGDIVDSSGILTYFKGFNFTGKFSIICLRDEYYEITHKMKDGLLHCEDGPAMIYTKIDNKINKRYDLTDEYCWYKRGKPWYCLVRDDVRSFYSNDVLENE
jgi:hypothetical protein